MTTTDDTSDRFDVIATGPYNELALARDELRKAADNFRAYLAILRERDEMDKRKA